MSAFAVIYERENTSVDPGVFNKVMERLSHRGPDGSDGFSSGNVAMGHWRFWTTPEETGEKQPLKVDGLPFKLVMDGRLDNRSELFNALRPAPGQNSMSDATLALLAYAHWGSRCFEYFVGEYAIVILDEQRGELVCARDALGCRTLFYAFYGTQLVVASEPWAVAGANKAGVELDERAAAHYFSINFPEDGQTIFKSVYELLPAHAMLIHGTSKRVWRHWQPDFSKKNRFSSDEEYAERFLSALEESVRCRLRSTTPVGILMSGGLDSTSVACLAARMLAPQPLTTISKIYNELPDCDERQYIDAVTAQWGTRSIQIPCDDAWPYKDWQNWPRQPNGPSENLYYFSVDRVLGRARDEGLRVILSGSGGDDLYYRVGQDWLADLLLEGRLQEIGRYLSLQIRRKGVRKTLPKLNLRLTARRLLEAVFPAARLLHFSKSLPPPWLSPMAVELLKEESEPSAPAFGRYATLLGLRSADAYAHGVFNTSRYQVEHRSPYRDQRLIEFVLSLPAYQLYNGDLYKHILRVAMKNILPETIRSRRQPTYLLSLYFRGIEQEKDGLKAGFQNTEAVWRKYIQTEWLLKHWNVSFTPAEAGASTLVSWFCISYDMWHKSLARYIENDKKV